VNAEIPAIEAAATSLVALHGVGVNIGHKEALRGIDLDVEKDAFIAIIGADGAGKSTLLRVLAGLRRPTSGSVLRVLPKEEVGFSGAEFDLYTDLNRLGEPALLRLGPRTAQRGVPPGCRADPRDGGADRGDRQTGCQALRRDE